MRRKINEGNALYFKTENSNLSDKEDNVPFEMGGLQVIRMDMPSKI